MKYVVTTLHTPDWQEFADVTDANKREYCARHGYAFYTKNDKWNTRMHTGTPDIEEMGYEWGFERAYAFKEAFEAHPECEWVLFSDTDAMITNKTIELDRVVDNRFHVILPADINGTNCGNILIKNSEIGRGFVQSMIGAIPAYRHNPMAENQWIQEMAISTYWKKYIKIVPQRILNSYDFTLYQFPKHTGTKDVLGVDGQWQKGDFILHIVGGMAFDKLSLKQRINVAKEYISKIVE